MKPSDSQAAWQKLIYAAQKATPDERELEAPPGFATRVVALAAEFDERPFAALLENFSLRALTAAGILAAVAVAATLSPVLSAIEEDVTVVGSDPVAELSSL